MFLGVPRGLTLAQIFIRLEQEHSGITFNEKVNIMEKKYYTARKTKPDNREIWILEYRHPLVKDPNGKTGKKVRKGLGTSDAKLADEYVKQMNILLSNESFWNPSAKLMAKTMFHHGIVESFYGEIEYVVQGYENKREEIIPLKNPETGYSRVLLLGSTGAGKTTLLRQLLGTDPIKEKFPATSTAKTTVFDSEFILSEGNYKSVVTFYSEGEVREMIKDSLRNAIKKYYSTNDPKETLRIFLEDEEQRFRLSYVIGKIKEKKKFAKYESSILMDDQAYIDIKVTEEEQIKFEEKITKYLDEIIAITRRIITALQAEFKEDKLKDEDKIALEELIESEILDYEGDDLLVLADDIVEEIKERFKLLNPQELETEKFGWPICWKLETPDRESIIKSMRFFSSNSSFLFGKLLTPLVSGLRVQGPFKPENVKNIPKLVIIDGEGLGHIPDTTSNLPSKTIKKFDETDAIILVDSVKNPMQAAPYAVLKSTAISGHYRKLFICFTHFDEVKGDNLPTIQDKVDHVYGSVDNLLGKLETELGYEVKKYLVQHLQDATYYFANLDERFQGTKYDFSNDQLIELSNRLERMIRHIPASEACPEYDVSTLLFKIQSAANRFHNIWDGYLKGSSKVPGIKKAHFTQVKALTRRLGYSGENEYSYLRPISDFWASFSEQISGFLSAPISWSPSNPTEEEKSRKIDEIKKKVSSKLGEYAILNIKEKMISEWQTAYNYVGRGSTALRIDEIDTIYDKTIPIPFDDMNIDTRQFAINITKILKDSIIESGGNTTSIL